MSAIHIQALTKQFDGRTALADVSLDIAAGEFLAVLGPSGCGKTTLLRLLAGFETVSAGTIHFGERLVSSRDRHLAPEERGIGIVFQSYALWPHMSVADNVGYSLKIAGVAPAERRRRVGDALSMVGLAGQDERPPAELSGGQRQRVALARCLAARPAIVLLDEPLANLDVHLRAAMEEEFAAFHARSGATMIYITHDQSEAMALASRIAVMEDGRLLQLASPSTLYREPASAMVASFIGQGFTVPVTVTGPVVDGRCAVEVFGCRTVLRARADQPAGPAIAALHARDLRPAPAGEPGLPAEIRRLVYRGGHLRAELAPTAAPALRLALDLAEPTGLAAGMPVALHLTDGWVIPAPASRSQG